MTRRTLLKLAGLLPFAGPLLAKALAQSFPQPAVSFVPYLPSYFPGWNRVVDGLEDAGKWALDIELSHIPANVVMPREGQVWQALRDCEVHFQASIPLRSPFVVLAKPAPVDINLLLGFGTAQVPCGERVRILEPGPKSLNVSFVPVRYHELQEQIIPEVIRKTAGYGGYTLSLKIAKTVADLCRKGSPQLAFSEVFRLLDNPS
ncbi:MAG TPA: hypothetical protein VL361_00045 [Candidatus Limnocylindrales bacterium]|jgi:hypothetical protein|nr:hypothetical protein [Candidatus Limnocylindrales bacterium]